MSGKKPKPLHETEVSDLSGINVDGFLHEGGYSWVYHGFEENTQEEQAVKVLFSEDAQHNFKNEIKALETLKHPNLVELISYGSGETSKGETKYLVEEFVKGKDLEELIYFSGKIKYPDAVKFIHQICFFLKHVHEKGFIYRDLTPANMIITPEETIKFIDPALVTKSPWQNDMIVGTPGFTSPDILTMFMDHRSDIYCTGILFYNMLTGKVPFKNYIMRIGRGGLIENLKDHRDKPRPRIQDYAPDVPETVCSIAEKMMQPEIDKRYQNVEEVVEDLRNIKNTDVFFGF